MKPVSEENLFSLTPTKNAKEMVTADWVVQQDRP
jgi:hypothetical protein